MIASIAAQQIDRGAPDEPDTAAEKPDRENTGHSAIGTGNVRMERHIDGQGSGADADEASDPRKNCAKSAQHHAISAQALRALSASPLIGVPQPNHAGLAEEQ